MSHDHASGSVRPAAHSLHPGRAGHAGHDPVVDLRKADRFLVGFLSGVALFYFLGRAFGLGRGEHRETGA